MSERLPSAEEALKLLYEAGCSPEVIKHSKAVTELAIQIAKRCQKRGQNVDIQLVRIGALLHDIGRSRTHSIHHILIGAKIAKLIGLPNSIVSIIERHAGTITIDEAKKLGWPTKSYLPQTLEERIIAYADKLIEGARRVPIERSLRKLSRKHGSTHSSIKKIRKLHEEFLSLIGDFDASRDGA